MAINNPQRIIQLRALQMNEMRIAGIKTKTMCMQTMKTRILGVPLPKKIQMKNVFNQKTLTILVLIITLVNHLEAQTAAHFWAIKNRKGRMITLTINKQRVIDSKNSMTQKMKRGTMNMIIQVQKRKNQISRRRNNKNTKRTNKSRRSDLNIING